MIASAEKAARLDEMFRAQLAFTPELELLDEEEVLARLPILRPGYAAAAFYDPNFWDIEVESLLQGYVKAARRNGTDVRERHAVISASHDGQVWTIETSAGVMRAKTVVNAAGGWADQTAELFGVKPLGIVQHRRTAITVDLPEGIDIAAMPEINEIDEDFYMKPDAGRLFASPADATPCEPGDVPAGGTRCRLGRALCRGGDHDPGPPRGQELGRHAQLFARQAARHRLCSRTAGFLLVGGTGRFRHPDLARPWRPGR